MGMSTKPTIRTLRQRLGWRREDLASKAVVSFNTVQTCERTNTWPKQVAVRRRMQLALGVAV